jgi:flagellar protein FlaG
MIDTSINAAAARVPTRSAKSGRDGEAPVPSNASPALPNERTAVGNVAASAALAGARPGDHAAKKTSAEDAVKNAATPAKELADAVEDLNGLMQSIRRELHFSVDDESGRTVIKVVDARTQEVIRHIPREEVATVVDRLGSGSAGLTRGVKV